MKVLVQAKSHDAPLSSSGTAVAAFAALQKALTDTTPFENPEHGAPTSLMVNASGVAAWERYYRNFARVFGVHRFLF